MISKCPTEEKIIDYYLGNLANRDSKTVYAHIQNCLHCNSIYSYWQEVLYDVDDHIKPTHNVRTKILSKIEKKNKKRFSFPSKKPALFITALCAVFLVLLFNQSESSVQLSENKSSVNFVENSSFRIKDDTRLYEVVPIKRNNIKGYAWVNPTTDEMYLLVDGLHPQHNNDYQAWIQTAEDFANAGLLNVSGKKGQLYIQDGMIHDVEHIVVSKEPLGGSRKLTDPQPYLIRLNSQ